MHWRLLVASLALAMVGNVHAQTTSSGGVPALKEELVIEVERATKTEQKLDTSLLITEMELVKEVDRAKAAEMGLLGDLTLRLEYETAARISADADEAAARAAADTEIANATLRADAQLRSDLASETAARIQGDQGSMAASSAYTDGKVAAEAAARAEADAALQSGMDAEVAARHAADASLQATIDAIPQGPIGPQGPQGEPGPAGPAGPVGPAGPSGGGVTATWSWFPRTPPPYQPIPLQSNATGARIIGLDVPEDGLYLLFATLRYSVPAEWLSMQCLIAEAPGNVALVRAAALPDNPGTVSGTLTMHAAYWFPAGQTLEVLCQASTPTDAVVKLDQLLFSAILVTDFRVGTPQ